MQNNNQTLAAEITKALAYTENGGAPKTEKAGKTGEMKSVFQFEPATWKAYAGEILGNPNAPLTPQNESAVVYKKVSDWLNKGLTPQQIASSWNAGPGEPNAYTGKFSDGTSSKGVNAKYGVAYDVPGYVNKFEKYLNQFTGTGGQGLNPTTPPATATSQSTPQTSQTIADTNPVPVQRGLLGTNPPQQGLLSKALQAKQSLVSQK